MAINPIRNRQILAFVLSWIAYASSYLLRKPLGVVKSDLTVGLKMTKAELGWLDTALLLPYAVMQMLLGSLGDRYGSRKTLGANLITSSLAMVTFGFWKSLPVFAILLFINGTAQATCWPNCVKALSSWYTEKQRATIFGIWGTCTFAGGVLGTGLAVQLQSMYSPNLIPVFVIPAVIVFSVGLLVLICLKTPDELNVQVTGKEIPLHNSKNNSTKTGKGISFLQMWKIRMLPELAWTTFCMKLVRYCLYMWLPLYLFQSLKYTKSQAGFLSTVFEIGGVLGSAGMGVFVNSFMNGRTHWGVFFALIGSAVSLALFQFTSTWGWLCNVVFMFLAGVCNCGPDAFVSGSLAAELGEHEGIQSAVSGMINGFGSLGTVIEGPVIGIIAELYGWSGTFYFMIILSILSAIAMLRAARINDHIKRQAAENVF